MTSKIRTLKCVLGIGWVLGGAGCTVGLQAHPLSPGQREALGSRPVPAAEQQVAGLTTIRVAVPISAPAASVWDQLAVRYGDVHEWSGPIENSKFVDAEVGRDGARRACTLGPNSPLGKGETFTETILVWDPEHRFFLAGVDDGFYPLRQVAQEFWVRQTPSGSEVVSQFHYDMSFPMGRGRALRSKLKPQIVRSLLGLKHLVETGRSAEAQDPDFLVRQYPAVLRANGVS